MDDNNQPTSPQPAENTDLAKQYQDILDNYSKELASKPAAVVPAEPEIPATIPLTEVPPPPPPAAPDAKPLTPPSEPESPKVSSVSGPIVSKHKGNNFFKFLFFISLVIFLAVCGAILFTVISSKQNGANTVTPAPVSVATPTVSAVCQLNNQTYQVGQSFDAADNCNTCTCQADLTITCTQRVCEATPTATVSAVPKTWKTYTDKTNGFSFKYPSASTVTNHTYTGYVASFIINKISSTDPNTNITFYISNTDESQNLSYPTTPVIIGGLNAVRESLPMGQNPPQEEVFFSNSGKYYHFQFVWDGKDQNSINTFNQILSTFKFTALATPSATTTIKPTITP